MSTDRLADPRLGQICQELLAIMRANKLDFFQALMVISGLVGWFNRETQIAEQKLDGPGHVVPRFTARLTLEVV